MSNKPVMAYFKSRKHFIAFIFLAALVFLILFFQNHKKIENKNIKLNQDDEDYLTRISRKTIEQYLHYGQAYEANDISGKFYRDNAAVVSLYYESSIIGIGEGHNKNLANSVIDATIAAIKDEKFGKINPGRDLSKIKIIITIINKTKEMIDRNIVNLSDNINLGVDGLMIRSGNYYALIPPQFAMQNSWNKLALIQNLCLKARMKKNCWIDPNVSMYKFDSTSFEGIENGSVEIYRAVPLVEFDSLTKGAIYDSIMAASDWQLRIQKKDGNYEYYFNPVTESYSRNNNLIRQALAAYSMAKVYWMTNNKAYLHSSEESLDFILSHMKQKDEIGYLELDNVSILGAAAVTVLAILELPGHEKYQRQLDLLTNFLKAMQREDGSFKTYYNSNYEDDMDFYPGETLLAFVRLYKATGDKKYLDAVEKSFPFYSSYFARTPHTQFVMWQTSTFYEMYEITGKKEYANFVFQMTDWIVGQQYIDEAPYPDYLGGFKILNSVPGASAPVFVEGIADAYKLALLLDDHERIDRYGKSLRVSSRFILQLQFDKSGTYYIKNPEKVIGAMRESLASNNLRVDYTSHSIMALLKVYDVYDNIR